MTDVFTSCIKSNNVYDISTDKFELTDFENTCSGTGKTILRNEEECKLASVQFTNGKFQAFAGAWKNYPKRCFLSDDGYVKWNPHETGKMSEEYRSICFKGPFKYPYILICRKLMYMNVANY